MYKGGVGAVYTVTDGLGVGAGVGDRLGLGVGVGVGPVVTGLGVGEGVGATVGLHTGEAVNTVGDDVGVPYRQCLVTFGLLPGTGEAIGATIAPAVRRPDLVPARETLARAVVCRNAPAVAQDGVPANVVGETGQSKDVIEKL